MTGETNTPGEDPNKVIGALGAQGLSMSSSTEAASLSAEATAKAPLTEETMRELSGFRVAVYFPRWQKDKAAMVGYHDEHQRLGEEYGWHNVFGSQYFDSRTGELTLGVFIREGAERTLDSGI